jgi:hypothetical protein
MQTSVYLSMKEGSLILADDTKFQNFVWTEILYLFFVGIKFVLVDDHNALITGEGEVMILYVGCLLYSSCNNFVYKILTAKWIIVY